MEKIYRILVINPGSTSTKIAVFDNEKEVFSRTLRHSTQELQPYKQVADQFGFRKQLIVDALLEANIDIQSLSAVIGRGGLVKPIPSGVYEINETLKHDLIHAPQGEHQRPIWADCWRPILLRWFPEQRLISPIRWWLTNCPDIARIAGHELFKRVSIFHALNQKAVARAYARSVGKQYDDLNLIVAHLGGGISVGAHRHGRVIDVSNALDGEGPFSPERSGALPAKQLVDLCFSGRYTEREVDRMISGRGGLVSLTGSNNVKELVERALNGDQKTLRIIEAMAYNVGKEVGCMAAVLHGNVNAILITGGMAYSQLSSATTSKRWWSSSPRSW